MTRVSGAPGEWKGGAVVIGRERYFVTRRIFFAGLGLVYLTAFVSLGVQIEGLIGERGILPATEFLSFARARLGPGAAWAVPNLGWWIGAGDGALVGYCVAGAASASLLAIGVFPMPSALVCWALYLTIHQLGRRFLGFQWDILLLETGFLAIFFAPPFALHLGRETPEPSRAVLWVLRFVLFKVMFSSGVVKLAAGDPSWRDLTALTFHYETTCLPTWTGWWMHQAPRWFHQGAALAMYVVELAVPFLIFAGRSARAVAAGAFAALMALIGATGNYGFFNLLTVVLAIPLLDDAFWPVAIRRALEPGPRGTAAPLVHRRRPRAWSVWIVGPLVAVLALLQVRPLLRAFRKDPGLPSFVEWVEKRLGPWQLAGGYGLFAHMTKTRPEIVVEGSRDGREWSAYRFRYKPGDAARRPGFAPLHMPRLDWQMWFAALRPWPPDWFVRFARRLAEGSPEVLALLETNPFGDAPPKYVRALRVDYRFTTPAERRETGAWWKLGPSEEFLAPITAGRDQPVEPRQVR